MLELNLKTVKWNKALHVRMELKKETLLVIAPHADDEILGCCGLINKVKENGGKVFVHVLSIGGFNKIGFGKIKKESWKAEFLKVVKFLNIDESEYNTLACNVLPLSENKCLIVSGNDKTRSIIDRTGIETIEFEASEICYKGSGGPTCITRPIHRK